MSAANRVLTPDNRWQFWIDRGGYVYRYCGKASGWVASDP